MNSVVKLTDGYGHGSGVIIDVNCVVTAAHVAEHSDLVVQTLDGDEHKVLEIIMDQDDDLAYVIIDGEFDEPPLKLDAKALSIGDRVVGLGYPPDAPMCVLPGVIVGVDASIMHHGVLVITDAHTTPGCSGGPLLDSRGRVRAIHVAGGYGLGLEVPISRLDPR
jgi:S1-C subfamily serine protease